ncbi:MAG: hypothetical protein Q8T03_00960 [Bacteroidota bacterium]|nr:hypothetical protein [Bacteroidota bacterium]
MRFFLLYILILTTSYLKCQDKLFFLDGSTKKGKVTEISSEQISGNFNDEIISFPRQTVLLIEYSNGLCEIINAPQKNIIALEDKKENFHFKQAQKEIYNYNQISLNSLALTIADISAFYERILPSKKIGLGIMGAYNINQYANAVNLNISVLSNAKKNYDLGGFINFYPSRFEKRTRLHFGMMIKYTSFNFSSVKDDSVIVGNLISVTTKYTPAKGSQLATIFTIGSHTDITETFFIKTIFGLGAFKLKGEYKTQYNLEINKQNNQSNNNNPNQPVSFNFLPKFYFGINLGFKL